MDALRFSAEDGVSLEGELRLPDGHTRGSAVVCHPHPEHGGSKDHLLLWAIRNELVARGLAVLSFNFRGCSARAARSAAGGPRSGTSRQPSPVSSASGSRAASAG